MVALKTPPNIITTREKAAEELGLTRAAVERLVRDGVLETTSLFGGPPRLLQRSVDALKGRIRKLAETGQCDEV